MKRHGLWRFHREAREVRKSSGFRWWLEDEIERVYRMISVRHMGYGRTLKYTNADAIVKCARRYASMFGVELRTVAQWNALVEKIGRRAGYDHHTTLRSAKIELSRDKSRIRWPLEAREFCRPGAPSMAELVSRQERLLEAKKERESVLKPCCWCGTQVRYKKAWMQWDGAIRCNSRECRHIDHLSRITKTHGGIDLTPRQKKAVPRDAWRLQQVTNYLALRAKEKRNEQSRIKQRAQRRAEQRRPAVGPV